MAQTEKIQIEKMQTEELDKEECLKLRPLWEEVFAEDSEEFTEYYFRQKAHRNHAFAMVNRDGKEDGEIVSMLHLAPYAMEMRTGDTFLCMEINYIIGVATKENYRHRGYMDRLLKMSMEYMYGKKQPFTFLMPANPAIYTPYQFAYIYDREEFAVTDDIKRCKNETITVMGKEDISAIVKYAGNYLKTNYDVFIRRDEAYYRTLEQELAVRNGNIYLWAGMGRKKYGRGEERKQIGGYFLYTEEAGKADIQEAVWNTETEAVGLPILSAKTKTPIIMARIVNVKKMFQMLRAKGKGVKLLIEVTDPVLKENAGVWSLEIKEEKTDVVKAEGQKEADCAAGIDGLTSWIFGYRRAEECFSWSRESTKAELLKSMDLISTFRRVFINEIV